MFGFPSDHDWGALGTSLGLAPYAPSASYGHGASFRQLKRGLCAPAGSAPKLSHWHFGQRHGTEVMVLTYEVGSGSSSTTYTGALARVDPPLFLGLGVSAQSWADSVFGGKDIELGHLAIDKQLRIHGFDAHRIALLLSPSEPTNHELLDLLVAAATHYELLASDSVVAVSHQGTETNVSIVADMLDRAVAIALRLAQRRPAIPHSPGERAQVAEWQRFAQTHGLAFDSARMCLEGNSAAGHVQVALESDGQLVRTAITARFPQSIGVRLSLRSTRWPSFLQRLFMQDITLGNLDFDDRYVVNGSPEQAVRAALAKPALLEALTWLASRSTEVQMNDAELFFRVARACSTGAELRELLATAQAGVEALFGAASTVRPYR